MFRYIISKQSSFIPRVGTTHRSLFITRGFSTGIQPPEDKEKDIRPNLFPEQNKKMLTDLIPKKNQFFISDHKKASYEKINDQSSSAYSQKKMFKSLLQDLLHIILHYIIHDKEEERGFIVARWIRHIWMVMDCKIDAQEHEYEFTLLVGSVTEIITEKNVFNFFAEEESVGATVPLAFKGKDNVFFANREHGGIANAFILGKVKTENYSESFTIVNTTQSGHLLHDPDNPGTVTINIFRKEDKIYVKVKGVGTGNFAMANNILGKFVFQNLIEHGINKFLRKNKL
ncbi:MULTISPECIES: hypothetical protein [unclassified Chryseobacterium]|uniref:hypothetical protein n=1 Tax=unclassified Chryseobacterium TaxID=2593645 RepID=UPI00100B64C1|nr:MULTISPECIES: hypothetical protein [unclassified Chryseobacterium]RXM51665.1 hypothetical protein BOQ64_12145 [Chryseobacterium sp. CH25]RXM67242.1 hypothetical protein BOQ60_04870 [Chryseobacterium sp. CH1]